METESGFSTWRVTFMIVGAVMIGAGEVELIHYFLPSLTPVLSFGVFFCVAGCLFTFGAIWWGDIRRWIKPKREVKDA